jgi:para-nitrobenzyl esterase
VLDGKIVVEAPNEAIAGKRWAKIPVMIGANSADLGMTRAPDKDTLFNSFGPAAAQARAAYDPDGSATQQSLNSKIGADRTMVEPARLVAKLVSDQGLPAYEFRFSYVAESIRTPTRGASHASEIPFAFDTVKARYGDKLTAADAAMAKTMNTYWATFAKTGVPSAPGAPAWPRYGADDQLMDFTNTGPVVVADPWKARLDAVAASSK